MSEEEKKVENNREEKSDKTYSKKQVKTTIVTTAIITFLVSCIVTLFVYYNYLDSKGAFVTSYQGKTVEEKTAAISAILSDDEESSDSSATISSNIETYSEYIEQLDAVLKALYLEADDIDENELLDAALKGYVFGLGDEYTELMTASEYESLTEQLSDYVGIGIYVAQTTDGEVVILAPVGNDSPAFAAGIEAGDVIIKVNGEDVTALTLDEVVSKVKGEEGTKVNVTVDRDGEELSFDVERKDIKVAEITYKMIDSNIGYIDFDSFTEDADDEFKEAYESLVSQGMTKLIIDLRNNTGGYVDTAENILEMFLDEGQTEYITVDNEGNESTTTAQTSKTIDMDVVILTNEYSASASEIFTGCLKDYGIATVVGTTTYGKGVIQSIIPVLEGNAYLKITTMKYVTPNKNEINKVGIEPDVEVELEESDDEDDEDYIDNQLQEAIDQLK